MKELPEVIFMDDEDSYEVKLSYLLRPGQRVNRREVSLNYYLSSNKYFNITSSQLESLSDHAITYRVKIKDIGAQYEQQDPGVGLRPTLLRLNFGPGSLPCNLAQDKNIRVRRAFVNLIHSF